MYEPPNRGGKTHGTLNRGVGGNDPGAFTDAATLAQTFLWPRGYSTVWSGWENNLGPLSPASPQRENSRLRKVPAARPLQDRRTNTS